MINYSTKFDTKANNMAFFLSEKMVFKNNLKFKPLDNAKILSFLKKNKYFNKKKILSLKN